MEKPIGIIGAMQVEIEAILEAAEIRTVEEHGSMPFYLGTLAGVEVAVSRCHAGKVNSALCAQVMADHYRPRAILNVGVAGGIGPDVHIGDVVVATACVQYDYDITAFGDPLGQIEVPVGEKDAFFLEFPCDPEISRELAEGSKAFYDGAVHRGIVATGDTFVADPETGLRLHKQFQALACEMEGGSIVHACLLNQIPCAVLRSISDNANDNASVDFPAFAKDSAYRVQKLLTSVIGQL